MQLIYRGHSYRHTATQAQPTHQPRAINWRYRLPGADQKILPLHFAITAAHSVPLHAINWRYQIPVEG